MFEMCRVSILNASVSASYGANNLTMRCDENDASCMLVTIEISICFYETTCIVPVIKFIATEEGLAITTPHISFSIQDVCDRCVRPSDKQQGLNCLRN